MDYFGGFGRYLKAVKDHAVKLVTSSIIAAGISIEEHLSGRSLSGNVFGCIALTFLFMATFFAWQDRDKKVLSAERRKHICDELARYAEQGEIILAECLHEAISEDSLNSRFSNWVNDTKAYLTVTLGKSYSVIFDSFIGDQVPPGVQATTIRQNVWMLTWHRVYRLGNIMKEYQAPYLGN